MRRLVRLERFGCGVFVSVDKLIEQARKTSPFTDAMLADIRQVLAANDAESNRLHRVTVLDMIKHLHEKHGYGKQRCAFEHDLRQALGRSWSRA
jgi:hypothetical protein